MLHMNYDHIGSDCSSDDGQQHMQQHKHEAVEKPNDRDVLCGRGGLTNTHPGNAWYRNLVRANRPYYRSSPKHGKILVAKAIVNHVFAQSPPCRFLEKSRKDGKWYPVDWKRSVDKTSQALRERERHLDSPLREEDTAALAEQMILLKNARSNGTSIEMGIPQLILPPQPDYQRVEVKRQSNKSFSLIAESSIVPEQSKKRKASDNGNKNIKVSVPLHLPARPPPPSSTTPAVAALADSVLARNTNNDTNNDNSTDSGTPSDMEAVVTQVSARFWRNSMAKGRVKLRPSEPRARQRPLPSASLIKTNRTSSPLTTAVSTSSATTIASPGVELLSYLKNFKSPAPLRSMAAAPSKLKLPPTSLSARHEIKNASTTHAQNEGPIVLQDDQFADPDDDMDPTASLLSKAPIRKSAVEPKLAGLTEFRRQGSASSDTDTSTWVAPNTGALCRVCKKARFNAWDVPDPSIINTTAASSSTASAMDTHPELVWSISKSKSSLRAINAVLDHCLKVHPYWPLWNALPNDVQDGFPTTPRGVNVLHRALAVAANALPHQIGDTYGSSDELSFKVAQRIGLAEGYVKWGPWEFNDQRALQILASAMLQDYGTSLKMAIRYNWEKISTLPHQDRVDLFNNVFLVPYCINTLRENGDLFPPIVLHGHDNAPGGNVLVKTEQMDTEPHEKPAESSDYAGEEDDDESDHDGDTNADH